MVIFKYELELVPRQTVSIPAQSTLLSVATQRGTLCLWALVEPDTNSNVNRIIEIFGTGHPVNDGRRVFIGTALIEPFVWHVFERLDEG